MRRIICMHMCVCPCVWKDVLALASIHIVFTRAILGMCVCVYAYVHACMVNKNSQLSCAYKSKVKFLKLPCCVVLVPISLGITFEAFFACKHTYVCMHSCIHFACSMYVCMHACMYVCWTKVPAWWNQYCFLSLSFYHYLLFFMMCICIIM